MAATPVAPAINASSEAFESVPCNLCGSSEATLVVPANIDVANTDLRPEVFACTSPHVGQHGPIVRCNRCGLVFANPRPTQRTISQLYTEAEDNAYLREEDARVATFRHSLGGLKKLVRHGDLLDIGSHVGTFLEVARSNGYKVVGIEPSDWAARHARQHKGLDVRTGKLTDEVSSESFDVVTLWDVIEHLPDPSSELRAIHRVLRPGGLLALTTMNLDSLPPKLLRGRWPWYMLMHLYYFTPATLGRMLESAGFEVIEVGPHIRIAHARYLVSKVGAYSPGLERTLRWAVTKGGLGNLRIPINLGDLMTVYARKRT